MTSVILILADDLGPSDVGYRSESVLTPALNVMAVSKHTVLFDRFYANSPVCSPTRASLLTGRNPNRYGIWNANSKYGTSGLDFEMPSKWPLPTSEITISELLNQIDVHTGVFGKWHLGDLRPVKGGNQCWPRVTPRDTGFIQWNVTVRSVPTYHPNCGCFDSETISYCNQETFRYDIACMNYYSYHDSLIGYDQLIEDDNALLGDLAEQYLVDRSQDQKPFFLYLPFHTVHEEYIGTAEWVSYYRNLGFNLDTANYYATISGMDEQIGRIRNLVTQLNLTNTLIWFTSDNGPAHRTPGNTSAFRGSKGTLYEGGIRVPTLIEWPEQIRRNTRISNYVASSVDFFPTVAELWNITIPRNLDGHSLLPILNDDNISRPTGLGFGFDLEKRWTSEEWQLVWIRNEWKLMETLTSDCQVLNCVDTVQSIELYNVEQDRWEQQNVGSDQPILVRQLHDELHLWFDDVKTSIAETHCPNSLPYSTAAPLNTFLLVWFILKLSYDLLPT